ncbi:polysaccharide biosynthesis/export family protein [Hyphomicrobium sp. CS1GBMeth3]|uniref:polysaccharide biosynthesis/export family protein n=1 Tax=Hyphomicrobium sp. CS1GBMeth3 TaxID=1892845 RepID=UPI0015C557D4|nr:polysaccharide biosynthesis/export family protein [Hyphomicrobium sp. CS1GBMeth3]
MAHADQHLNRRPSVVGDAGRAHDLRLAAGGLNIGSRFGLVLPRASKVALWAAIGACLAFQPMPTVRAESGPAHVANQDNAGQPGDVYRLGIGDKVRVQVFEWRPARDEVFTWTALNQVYSIDPVGALFLPLIGQVSAAGYTTSELATLISRRLAKRLNLGASPDTTVEVTEFRPIFVTGHVEKAGEYPYSPGMTLLQGVSLSGGLYKNAGLNGLRLEREFLTVSGEYDRLTQERDRLLTRKARIEAELAFADRIAFPADLRTTRRPYKVEFTASLMAKEQSVFELRNKAYETQVTALNQLQNFLEQEVETLNKRLESHQKQIDLMAAELGGIKKLTDKGLSTQPRLLGLQRNLAQLEGERLRIESERTRVQQEISRIVLSKIEFDNKRANDLTTELQTTEARLEQVLQEANVNEQLLVETQSQAAASPLRLAATGDTIDPLAKPQISYTIVRQVKDGVVEIDGNEATQLRPGDTIKVNMALPRTGITAFPKHEATPATTIEPPKPPHQASVEKISTDAVPH